MRVVILALVLAMIFAGCTTGNTIEEQAIKMAWIGPFTGDPAQWGNIERNILAMEVEKINNAGGVNGRPIEMLYEDGKCMGKEGLAAAKKLVEVDGVQILLISCSQEILPIGPYADQKQVIAMCSTCSASTITEAGDFVFRTTYSNADYSQTAAEVMSKYSKVAIITEQTDFAADLRDLFVQSYDGESIEINFPAGAQDVRSEVTKALLSKPDAIFVNPTAPGTGMRVLKALEEQGYSGPLYGNFFGSSTTVQETEYAKEMTYFADPKIEDEGWKSDVFREYEKRYGKRPSLEYYMASRYDSFHVLVKAIDEVGARPERIRDYLYSMEPVEGMIGTFSFDEKGDVIGPQPSIRVVGE